MIVYFILHLWFSYSFENLIIYKIVGGWSVWYLILYVLFFTGTDSIWYLLTSHQRIVLYFYYICNIFLQYVKYICDIWNFFHSVFGFKGSRNQFLNVYKLKTLLPVYFIHCICYNGNLMLNDIHFSNRLPLQETIKINFQKIPT